MKKELMEGIKHKLYKAINYIKMFLSITGLVFIFGLVFVGFVFIIELLDDKINEKVDIGSIILTFLFYFCALILFCMVCSLLSNIITHFSSKKLEIDYKDKNAKSKLIKIVFDLYFIFYLWGFLISTCRLVSGFGFLSKMKGQVKYIVLINVILIIISKIFYCFSNRNIYNKVFTNSLNKDECEYLERKNHNDFNSLLIMMFTSLVWYFLCDGYYYNKKFLIVCITIALIFTVSELIIVKKADDGIVNFNNNKRKSKKILKSIYVLSILVINSFFVFPNVMYLNSNFWVREIDSFNTLFCNKEYSMHSSKNGRSYTCRVTNPHNGNEYEFTIGTKGYHNHYYNNVDLKVYKGILGLEWAKPVD